MKMKVADVYGSNLDRILRLDLDSLTQLAITGACMGGILGVLNGRGDFIY